MIGLGEIVGEVISCLQIPVGTSTVYVFDASLRRIPGLFDELMECQEKDGLEDA